MFNSPTFNNFTTSPILYVDNTLSYLAEELNPSSYLSSSYYHLPASPLICNETDIYLDSFLSQNDVLQIISPPLNASTSLLSDDHSSEAVLKSTTEMVDPNKAEETASGIVAEDENNKNKKKKKKKKKIMRSPSGSHNGLRVKRRSSKKDRHSKIKTAQGLRDRRMRLSLEVARSFFSLQDMLGYDKASRTVEWLLIQSKPAIEELLASSNDNKHLSGVTTANKCTMSSNSSDCEVESVIIEEEQEEEEEENNNNNKGKRSSSTKEKRPRQVLQKRKRRTTKESREEARARARKRTLERKLMLSRVGHVLDKGNLTSCWGDFEMMEGSHNDSNSQISHKGSISINPVETGDHIVDSGFTTNWAAFGY